jgi:lipoprotein-anchoring transpeptidase ErfK/SrfK
VYSKYGKSQISATENLGSSELNKVHAQEAMLPQIADVVVPKPAEKPKTQAPAVTDNGQVIVIVLSEQKLYAYQDGQLVKSYYISSGVASHPTPRGTFRVNSKRASMTMSGPGYNLPHVPNNLGFTGDFFIHGAYWHHNFGHPMSHGCINESLPDAAWMFGWGQIGAKVVIK